MTDIEITKLCAEAMGYFFANMDRALQLYNPLYNDAESMALVKKFNLNCTAPHFNSMSAPERGEWMVVDMNSKYSISTDLNRAICECVAKMQKAKLA